MTAVAYVANTNMLELTGLRSEVEDEYIDDATVSAVIIGPTGATLGTVTLSFIVGSNGDYRGILSASLALVANKAYTARITANGGVDRVGYWEFSFRPQVRTT